jgi:HK97 family phage portal protein
MDILARLLGTTLHAGPPGPTDDYWYSPVGTMTQAGLRVDADGARKISAWYRGRDLLATSLAMLPLSLYERLSNDRGADVAREHPLYDILHRKPNDWQDSFRWRRQKMFHLIDFGNAYDWIVPGRRGFVDQLRPIHPSLVTPEQLTTGRVVFRVRNPKTHETRTFTQDEIFHLCGASDDGVVGKGVLEYARDSLGTSLATESYAARIFSTGALNGGIIEVPATLNDEASKRMAQSFKTAVGDWHLPKVLEQGAKWTAQDGMTPDKAQMLLSRKFSINDIARWLGIPPHMLGDLDRATFSNIEEQGQDFVTYSLGSWLSLLEFAINDQLVLAPQKYFAEFTRDALSRGKLLERWQAHVLGVNAGIKTVDEARGVENLNKRGGKADELREPANITGNQDATVPAAGRAEPAPSQPAEDPNPEDATALMMRATSIATASAQRLLRKEVAEVQKYAVRHAANEDGFVEAVTTFYGKHAALVAETLQVSETQAKEYCAGQANQIVNHDWLAALALWQTDAYAGGVAAMALEDAA